MPIPPSATGRATRNFRTKPRPPAARTSPTSSSIGRRATASRSRSAAAAPISCRPRRRIPEDTEKTGRRTDKRDLTAEWTAKSNNNVYVFDKKGFDAVDVKSGAKILGLFEMSHMEYEADRAKDAAGEPSLAEMTAMAIDRLPQDEDGFVLMVEGGRIDHAHHAGNAARALEDTLAFDAGDQDRARKDQARGHARSWSPPTTATP